MDLKPNQAVIRFEENKGMVTSKILGEPGPARDEASAYLDTVALQNKAFEEMLLEEPVGEA